jgi:hypothetical protein
MNIRPVGVELFCAIVRTGGHDEANNLLSQFCESVYKRKFRLLLPLGMKKIKRRRIYSEIVIEGKKQNFDDCHSHHTEEDVLVLRKD